MTDEQVFESGDIVFAPSEGEPGNPRELLRRLTDGSLADEFYFDSNDWPHLASVAAAAAGLRIAGPGDVVVNEARLREALEEAYEAGEASRGLDAWAWARWRMQRLTAAPAEEGQ